MKTYQVNEVTSGFITNKWLPKTLAISKNYVLQLGTSTLALLDSAFLIRDITSVQSDPRNLTIKLQIESQGLDNKDSREIKSSISKTFKMDSL